MAEIVQVAPQLRQRRWEDLTKDLIVRIFSNLGVVDLYAIFSVCSSWRDASKEPSLWRALDFRQWKSSTSHRIDPLCKSFAVFPRLLRFAIACGGRSVEKIWFPDFADEADLLFVAERCPKLCYFYINNGDICVVKFCEAVGKLKFLNGMAIHEYLICNEVLHQVSLCCASIFELRVLAEQVDLRTAMVICGYLPFLKKLELNDCRITHYTLDYFLDELKELEYLDISGCGRVVITAAILEKASHLKVFNWGWVIDEGEFSNCLDSDHDGNEADPCQFDMQFMEWLVFSGNVSNA